MGRLRGQLARALTRQEDIDLTIFTASRREGKRSDRQADYKYSFIPGSHPRHREVTSHLGPNAKLFSHRPPQSSQVFPLPHLTASIPNPPSSILHLTSIDHVQSRKADVGGNVSRGCWHRLLCAFPAEGREGCKLINFCLNHRRVRICGPSDMSQAMHAGVIRDIEQQRIKKERLADFEMQKALEEEYRKVQAVSDGGGGGEG